MKKLLIIATLLSLAPLVRADKFNYCTGCIDFTGTGGGGGSSTLGVFKDGVQVTSPTAQINFNGSDFTASAAGGTTAYISLNPNTTDFIHNQTSIQTATFNVTSGTVNGSFIVNGTTGSVFSSPTEKITDNPLVTFQSRMDNGLLTNPGLFANFNNLSVGGNPVQTLIGFSNNGSANNFLGADSAIDGGDSHGCLIMSNTQGLNASGMSFCAGPLSVGTANTFTGIGGFFSPTATLDIRPTNKTGSGVGLSVRQGSSVDQNNIQEWKTNGGVVLSSIDYNGNFWDKFGVTASTYNGGGLATCGDPTHALSWSGGTFGCQSVPGSGGQFTTINAANQFSLPYYSYQGSSNTLSGFPDAVVSTNTGVYLSTFTVSSMTVTGPSDGKITFVIGNSTYGVVSTSGPFTIGQCAVFNSTNPTVTSRACSSGGGGTPGGSNTQIQYNNSGSFGGFASAVTGSSVTLMEPIVVLGSATFLTGANTSGDTIGGSQGVDIYDGSAANLSTVLLSLGSNNHVNQMYIQDGAPLTVGFGFGTNNGIGMGNSANPSKIYSDQHSSQFIDLLDSGGNFVFQTNGGLSTSDMSFQPGGVEVMRLSSGTASNFNVRIEGTSNAKYSLQIDTGQATGGNTIQVSTNSELVLNGSAGTNGQFVTSQGPGLPIKWSTSSGGGGGSSSLGVFSDGVQVTSPTAQINTFSNDLSVTAHGATAYFALNPNTTDFIHNQNSLQSAQFNVSSGSAVSFTASSATFGNASDTSYGDNPYVTINSSGSSEGLIINVNGAPSGGYQNKKGALTIRSLTPGGPAATQLVLYDSTTDSQQGTGLMEIWEDNQNHNDPIIWIHRKDQNSAPEMRWDGPSPNWEMVNTSTDNTIGYGKWEPAAEAFHGTRLQVNSRAYDNSTFETVAEWNKLSAASNDPQGAPGLYFKSQTLDNDSGVISSSDTGVVAFIGNNGSFRGITGPLNPTASLVYGLPNSTTPLGQVIYGKNNGRGNNFNVRDWEFTTGGASGQFLQFNSGSAPTWASVSGNNPIAFTTGTYATTYANPAISSPMVVGVVDQAVFGMISVGTTMYITLQNAIANPTANYTATSTATYILANCGSACTITLPTAVGYTGRDYEVKIAGAQTSIAFTSGQTADGSTSVVPNPNLNADLIFKSDGANWRIR